MYEQFQNIMKMGPINQIIVSDINFSGEAIIIDTLEISRITNKNYYVTKIYTEICR